MKRRNFVATLLAGAAALPFVGKATAKESEQRQSATTAKDIGDDADCTCSLVHRESYSGIRCIDARITSGCTKHDKWPSK